MLVAVGPRLSSGRGARVLVLLLTAGGRFTRKSSARNGPRTRRRASQELTPRGLTFAHVYLLLFPAFESCHPLKPIQRPPHPTPAHKPTDVTAVSLLQKGATTWSEKTTFRRMVNVKRIASESEAIFTHQAKL